MLKLKLAHFSEMDHAFVWTNGDQYVWRHMPSLGDIMLTTF